MTSNYEVRVIDVLAMSLGSLRAVTWHRGQIVRTSTGDVAFETNAYEEPRTARLQAARYIKRYEHHLAKHGVGFEEQEKARKADLLARRKAARSARRETTDNAAELLKALQQVAPNHPLAVSLSWPDLPRA